MQRLNEDVFSPAAQRVLQRAWAIARSNGIEEVPLATLIEGLRQEDGIAREILERLGLHDPSPSDLGRLPALPPKRLLADEVNRVFDVAESWVREVSPHLTVGSEHVLYGLIHVSEPFAQKCAAAGLTLDGLRRELMDRSGFNTGPVAVTGVDLADTTAAIEDDAISLRILDASLNRVAEGLRTVEDYLRFGLNDSALAAEAKTIRHDLQPIARRFGD